MSTSITVLPEFEGADKIILHGTDGTTSAPIFGCFVVHWSCRVNWIFRGLLLDETMAIAFTGVADTLIAYLERTRMQPTQHLVDWVGRHRFGLPLDLQPGRFRHTDRPGCWTAELESMRCLYHSCHSLVWTVAPSSDAVCLP